MSELKDRIRKLASIHREAQSALAPGGISGSPDKMPTGESPAGGGALGADTTPPDDLEMKMGEPVEEIPEEPAEPEEETGGKDLDKPTPYIIRYHKGNFWVGKVYPEEYIDQAVKDISQKRSIPKEHVKKYLEKLKEGSKVEMPEELQNEPEMEEPEVPEVAAPGSEVGAPPEKDFLGGEGVI